jgi:hypothetical protein
MQQKITTTMKHQIENLFQKNNNKNNNVFEVNFF